MTAEIVQFQDNPNSLPTLPRSLEMLVAPNSRSPLEWEGEWYQRADGSWGYLSRWRGEGFSFDPSTVPEPVRRDAREALAVLERCSVPATVEEISRALGEIAIVCGVKASDGQEVWAARYAIYARELQDIPRDILRKAMTAHIRESVFFPKISELRERAKEDMARRRLLVNRLRRLSGAEAPVPDTVQGLGDRLRMK